MKTRWEIGLQQKEELTCWKKYFKRVLKQECPTIAEINEGVDTLNIDTDAPTVEEVIQAIKLLWNGKFQEIDQVYTEMMKAEEWLTPYILPIYYKPFGRQKQHQMTAWKVGLIVKLIKKETQLTNN